MRSLLQKALTPSNRSRLMIGLTLGSIAVFTVLGSVGEYILHTASPVVLLTLAWILLITLLWLLLNKLFRYVCRRFAKGIDEQAIERCRRNPGSCRRRLCLLRRLSDASAVLFGIVGASTAYLSGVQLVSDPTTILFSLPCAALLLYASLLRIRFPEALPDTMDTEERFPYLHQMAVRAADTLGVPHAQSCCLSTDFDCSVTFGKGHTTLHLGIGPLDVLSEEEPFAVLLHEFAHTNNPNRLSDREVRYYELIENGGNHTAAFSAVGASFFTAADIGFRSLYVRYFVAMSHTLELEADARMCQHTDPTVAASALQKIHAEALYAWEHEFDDVTPFHAPKKPSVTFFREYYARLRAFTERADKAWWARLRRLPGSTTHPSLETRLSSMGATDTVPYGGTKSEALQQDIDRLYAVLEDLFLADLSAYRLQRHASYVEAKELLHEWAERGCPLDNVEAVLSAMVTLGRCSDAKEFCDRILDSETQGEAYDTTRTEHRCSAPP